MERPIVTVKQGKLQGIVEENVLGSCYLSFKGIPFAAPPLGELRFKDPEPPASWEGVRDSSKNAGDVSIQFEPITQTIIGSEDCLYLNIYIPHNVYQTTGNPVMVWIHGGAFLMGSGNDTYTRPDYLVAKDVILVSINYRLGALGFLNLGHKVATGNQALKDQVAALEWIKENIKAFGGNPNNITVFGISAGSACTHYLCLSPLSKGLFHKAILQSGIITCDWAMSTYQPEATSFQLATVLGYDDSKDPEKVIEFLRKIPPSEIVKAQHKVLAPEDARILDVPFTPVIDDKSDRPFLPCSISQLLDNDNNIPVMLGHTSHEYIFFQQDTSDEFLKTMYTDLPRYVNNFLNSEDSTKINQLTERIKERYFNNKPFTQENIPSIIRWLSDLHFNAPIHEFVDKRRKRKETSTYLYQFSYVGNEMTLAQLMGNKLTTLGTSHTDEMSYEFYQPICKTNNPEPPAIGTNDRKVLEILTRMWTNFAKNGDPTPTLDDYITTVWLPATTEFFNYLNIDNAPQLKILTDSDRILKDSEL